MNNFGYYSDSLSDWIFKTIEKNDRKSIDAIRSLWDNEPWESIVGKLQTEGSTWIVWWNDGVNAYASMDYESPGPISDEDSKFTVYNFNKCSELRIFADEYLSSWYYLRGVRRLFQAFTGAQV